ncbi:hypothetical protein HSRCO_0041 [Halanaeroarchaeum sp. HSR-CO]|nr:hypothetical protein HSRCO_0041 [Halanaeroarchaeum sp. HSR-CO]
MEVHRRAAQGREYSREPQILLESPLLFKGIDRRPTQAPNRVHWCHRSWEDSMDEAWGWGDDGENAVETPLQYYQNTITSPELPN